MDCCCHKTKHRSDEEQKKLTHRLNRIEGQVRGLRERLQKDAYCPDILIQVSAVSAALNSFSKELMATHIRTCVADGIRQGDDAVIDELVTTLQTICCDRHDLRRLLGSCGKGGLQAQRRAERPGEPDAG